MGNARRAKAYVLYNSRDISGFITDFSYTDNTDATDDASLTLTDREQRWVNEWFPQTGDRETCEIQVSDWNGENDNRSLPLGAFEVDEVDFQDTVSVKAVSAPITSSIRSEKKSKSWEKITLKKIAGDAAKTAGLELVYETGVDPFYDKNDQNNKSDLEFLEQLCKSDGLCLKVTESRLIIFEESKYDQEPAVLTIKRGSANIIGFPKFKRNAKNIYTACEISYSDSKTDKTYVGRFTAPNVGKVGHVLKLQESFNSKTDDINLDRKAKARLREQNKKEWTADFTLKGDIIYFAGINANVEGWYMFDGKYNIKTVTHSISGGGYTVDLHMERCLEGY